ncbi:MAG: hypothetical protein PWR24_1949 [Desulfonauticus sp.]|nr:MAG: hypothetical protein XD41_1387 [Desulfonauticus sp. 38_4375]MDK2922392.1 hypothetical protein [Desulfonauticus sp.]
MVECNLAKVEVAGSNPVSRSKKRRHSQVVRQRSAKPPFSGSNPDAASSSFKGLPISGSNSVVECNLAKVEVAGSNPVSRSILYTFLYFSSSLKDNPYFLQ